MGLFGSFFAKFSRNKATPEDLDEFRRVLIESDIGAEFTDEILKLVEKERSEALAEKVTECILSSLSQEPRTIALVPERVTTILVVGVNGTGKTTSVAKMAKRFKGEGKKVLLAAADTFRAAAVEQLTTWGERIGAPVVVGKTNSDPASVAFDAATKATAEHFEILIIDTAGRLHTKSNLMEELTKVRRVVEKVTPIDEVLFVLDGTTGQNGITQARTFMDAVALTGLIVTKLDGSTKGGIALATERALKIPVKLIGTGEGEGDLEIFDPATYVSNLLTQP
ncbi:MAG: signal recognition particle-docking protein FtsY [Candidatus Nanopelagicaceae bacterium]|jgi:fused signal recognition particle receptor|nr:signal recognition particle-docking protein FtsY [Actinomycetota bacterium]NCV43613.1 signal recognition particle-docking protein FtsY [Actinomycetota bacterium]NCV83838.1 signal recognition particle-docking protein FtsY [Actinomycetota bacterium]NCV95835.1 signal recognition particle-docking protein FtsY [Actinomycetota bacterium]NCW46545.1 signal recognition particle-docking protein FtsY [Actinomycetota bacterium]